MIIGNGLIATNFKELFDRDDIIIFASGVSNSKESREYEFKREVDLLLGLKEKISYKFCLVYFSSCGVIIENSPYYKHKLNIEFLIKQNFQDYLILRIPQLIGVSGNSNTLINYFFSTIKNGQELIIQKYATRYFIEISDLVFIVKALLSNNLYYNNIINVAIPVKYNIIDVKDSLESVLNIKAHFKLVNGGNDYSIDLTFISEFLKEINFIYDCKYLEKSLLKLKL